MITSDAFAVESQSIEFGVEIGFEDRFDNRAALAATNHFGRRLRAGKQAERIDDNGFSGARFRRKAD